VIVDAAQSLGANHTRIILRHIMPNLFPSAVVIGTFSMASAIISEAALSFLGLGVPPEIPTWGSMLADGRTYISTSWWLAGLPGCIFSRCLASLSLVVAHILSATQTVGVRHR
jgi:peptide/nickel transport system permease protein